MNTDRELIDEAIELMREVGHRHDPNRSGRDLLEFSLAFMRETWIASSGQKPSDPEAIFKAVQRCLRVSAALSSEEEIEKWSDDPKLNEEVQRAQRKLMQRALR